MRRSGIREEAYLSKRFSSSRQIGSRWFISPPGQLACTPLLYLVFIQQIDGANAQRLSCLPQCK